MKTALVLGGGGAKGSYEIGVWQALRELEIPIDMVVGTSVGALNGAMVAQGEFDLALSLWKDVSVDKVMNLKTTEADSFEKRLRFISEITLDIIENGGTDTTPLRELVSKCVDEEKVRLSPVEFGLITLRIPDMKPFAVFKDDMENGSMIDYLMASSAFFPAMHAQKINGESFIDGGIYDNIPIETAVNRGAENIIAVDLKAPGLHRDYKGDVPVKMISPSMDTGEVLVFDKNISRENIRMGYFDTLKAFSKLYGVKYSFESFFSEKQIADGIKSSLNLFYSALYPSAVLKSAILRKLRIKGFEDRVKAMVLKAAEISGETLSVNPLEVYSSERFSEILRKKISEKKVFSLSEIQKAVKRYGVSKTAKELYKSKGALSRGSIAASLLNALENSDSEASKKKLSALCALFQNEFICAVFIKTFCCESGENMIK